MEAVGPAVVVVQHERWAGTIARSPTLSLSWLAMRELVSLRVEPSGSPLPHRPTIFPVEFATSASLCCLTTSFSTPPSVFPPSI